MATCHFTNELDAYRDGELDSARLAAMELHLPECVACAGELAELSSLSRVFMSSPPRLSQMGIHRLHQSIENVMEERLQRIAKILSAIAACVIVASSIWLVRPSDHAGPRDAKAETLITPPPWVRVDQVLSQQGFSDQDSSTAAPRSPVEAWYLPDGFQSDDLQ